VTNWRSVGANYYLVGLGYKHAAPPEQRQVSQVCVGAVAIPKRTRNLDDRAKAAVR
jgi:hypothetical protein